MLFSVTMFLFACGDNGGENYDIGTSTNGLATTVISDVEIDSEEGMLTLYGHNFSMGEWGYAEVILNDSIFFNIMEQSDEVIVAELPEAIDLLSGINIITVKTGTVAENIDIYALVPVGTESDNSIGPLLIVNAELLDESGQYRIYITGYNFDAGQWPPHVWINDIPIDIDIDASNSNTLVIDLSEELVNEISLLASNLILAVQTGTGIDYFDANDTLSILTVPGLPTDLIIEDDADLPVADLACNRDDLNKVPTTGEHCCTTAGETLCWSTGPIRDDTKNFFFNSDKIPRYFELTKDYVIPIEDYFSDPPPVSFPPWSIWGEGSASGRRERLKPLIDDLPYHFEVMVRKLVDAYKWDFLEYADGNLIIKKGYRWDGASVGWDRKYYDDRLLRTYLVDMRASLAHDAFYDMIRFCALPCETTDNHPKFGGKDDYRELADALFYLLAKEDGHRDNGYKNCALCFKKGKLETFYKTLRRLGQTKAKLHVEKDASWRFHTLADASATSNENEMTIDDQGDKYLNLTCISQDLEIELNAGNSRPIANIPQEGAYQYDLHSTNWVWTLNGIAVDQGLHQALSSNLFITPDKLNTTLNYDDIVGLNLTPGKHYPIRLIIDLGKNTDEAFFRSEDEVTINLIGDAEPPEIIGITKPIIAWPPNHKFKTFYLSDFVIEVLDNCTAMSLEYLTITQVSSDEPNVCIKNQCCAKDDIVISKDGKSVDLRIERQTSCKSNGRVYTIYIRAVDGSGNETVSPFEVHVPKAYGKNVVDDGPSYTVVW